MGDESKPWTSPTVVAALIGLVGGLGIAAFNNWDKIFPSSSPSSARTQPADATGGATSPTGSQRSAAPRKSDADLAGEANRLWRTLTAAQIHQLSLARHLMNTIDIMQSPAVFDAMMETSKTARAAEQIPADSVNRGDAQAVMAYANAHDQFGMALAELARLPEIKGGSHLRVALLSQIEDEDKRITAAIIDYNEVVAKYNAAPDAVGKLASIT